MGTQAPSPKRGGVPNFWLTSIVAKRLDGSRCHLVRRPRRRPHSIGRGPNSPAKGTQQLPPLFGPCLLWPQSRISATAELLSSIYVSKQFNHALVAVIGSITYVAPISDRIGGGSIAKTGRVRQNIDTERLRHCWGARVR